MTCPKCGSAVLRSDMLTCLDWTTFVCGTCRSELAVTKLSQLGVIGAAILTALVAQIAVIAVGFGDAVGFLVDSVTFFGAAYLGFGYFSGLALVPPKGPTIAP
jgi:hypothetical protein